MTPNQEIKKLHGPVSGRQMYTKDNINLFYSISVVDPGSPVSVKEHFKQVFYASMIQPHYPGRAFISRLPFLCMRCNQRPVTMSVANASAGSSGTGQCSERSADRSAAEPLAGSSSSSTEGENPPPGRRFAEEELTIHNLHRQACQVNPAQREL